MKEIIRMKDICTLEDSIETVRNGNLHVFENEIVGIVGKNQAGKSTLMGAVTGEYPCTSGEIWIREKKQKIESIEQARKEGIFLIKDSSSLIEGFTIEDTMRLNYAFAGKEIRYNSHVRKYRNTLKLLEVTDSYDSLVHNLNFHKRVLIEIAQALVCGARLLIFDNVISMLSSTARQQMHRIFRILRMQGVSVVLIENQEKEIRDFLNRLYIMRRGRVIAELLVNEMDEELIRTLVEGEPFVPRKSRLYFREQQNYEKILEFSQVSTVDRVIRQLDFVLYRQEILGIWNRNRHSGKAITDLLEGKTELGSGDISVGGKPYRNKSENKIFDFKLATVPEEDCLFTNMNVGENISISALKRTAGLGILRRKGEECYIAQELCGEYLSEEGTRIFPNQRMPEGVLFRKKVSLCRAIAAGAKVIVYNNPCLKMDMKERELFFQDILKTQKRNISQLIISSQLDTLYPVCSRILQVEEGRIIKEISK